MVAEVGVVSEASPFHAGEIAMQQHAGVRDRLEEIGSRVIRDRMPDQHRLFFRMLPTLVVGSVDTQRNPWASMLVGEPGFIKDMSAQRLRIDSLPLPDDALRANLRRGAPLGLLGIDPATRRRNRLNGRVVAIDGAGFELEVDQSFGNCPQYIQARELQWVDAVPQEVRPLGGQIDGAARMLVEGADTFFIASANAASDRQEGVDVSHRGGKPGFVRVDDVGRASVLTFPEFRGNFFFNTLGNLLTHPHAGLLFIDHTSGDVLQLTGEAEVIADGAELRSFKGAHYLVRVRTASAVWRPGALPLRWSTGEPATQLAATGQWQHGPH
jgi:predicted pyridoxine 5'-phosphate oxidase superfamily flavin-nucleotide-binding protein